MRPLKAVILSVNKKTGLRLRLESGATAVLPYKKDYNVGQEVSVTYNFIKREVTGIFQNKHRIEDIPEQHMHEDFGEDDY